MQIHCHQVIPKPMSDSILESDIWLRDITFTENKIYQIVAPSGTGKTSLVHILFGIRNDFTGTILFDDTDISSFRNHDWSSIRKSHISIVFQGLGLFPELNISENIAIKNKLTHYKSEEEIRFLIQTCGLESHTHKNAGILSFGQRQRLAIIRALCQPFDFILLDEPFSHLDEKNTEICMHILEEELQKRNASAIITSLNKQLYTTNQHVLDL
jgi:putative ABC transport system ATP-binding protein